MVTRCTNPRRRAWKDYGGRGITVCERWRESFEAFFADVGARPSPNHSIDRIDPDGDYKPGNVRWATCVEQNRNQRRTKRYELNGEWLTRSELAERYGVSYWTVRWRLEQGKSAAQAVGQ